MICQRVHVRSQVKANIDVNIDLVRTISRQDSTLRVKLELVLIQSTLSLPTVVI